MKCWILFSGKNTKHIISLSSPELAQRLVEVKGLKRDCTWLRFCHFLSVSQGIDRIQVF